MLSGSLKPRPGVLAANASFLLQGLNCGLTHVHTYKHVYTHTYTEHRMTQTVEPGGGGLESPTSYFTVALFCSSALRETSLKQFIT